MLNLEKVSRNGVSFFKILSLGQNSNNVCSMEERDRFDEIVPVLVHLFYVLLALPGKNFVRIFSSSHEACLHFASSWKIALHVLYV